MAMYTYRVVLVSQTPTQRSIQSHDYPYLSSAHHAAVHHVSYGGKAPYSHAKTPNGVRYSAQDTQRTASISWQHI